jgi:site-specific DNA-methyltransferase (adenine-specific)
MDLPLHKEGDYLPYKLINHHIRSVKEGGFLFALIENDFFDQVQASVFREEISKVSHIFGLIKLSETLFKSKPKSILILRKKGDSVKALSDFLLVDLPSFNDMEEFNKIINHIDHWISQREDDII